MVPGSLDSRCSLVLVLWWYCNSEDDEQDDAALELELVDLCSNQWSVLWWLDELVAAVPDLRSLPACWCPPAWLPAGWVACLGAWGSCDVVSPGLSDQLLQVPFSRRGRCRALLVPFQGTGPAVPLPALGFCKA